MTKEQLEAIRQRVHNKNWMDPVDGIDSPQPRIDRAALLEEVDRLRALRDRVAALRLDAGWRGSNEDAVVIGDRARCPLCRKAIDGIDDKHADDCIWLAAQTDPA